MYMFEVGSRYFNSFDLHVYCQVGFDSFDSFHCTIWRFLCGFKLLNLSFELFLINLGCKK